MSTGNPPAGYYADPSIPGYIRYWDGNEWVAGTSRPAPEEVADQVLASSQAGAAAPRGGAHAGPVEQQQDAVPWQPDSSGAQQYAQAQAGQQIPAQTQVQTQVQAAQQFPEAQTGQQFPEGGAEQQFPEAQTGQQFPEARAGQQFPAQAVPQVVPQAQAAQQVQVRGLPPQQYAQQPQAAPQVLPRAPQRQPQPPPAGEPASVAPQIPASVATMVVPSAFGSRTGTYHYDGANNPFAGLPGFAEAAPMLPGEEREVQTTVVELATPGSRILARIIDTGIAAVFSLPVTGALLLFAHKHDHQYVLRLDSQATTTYTTLGMDGLGITLWGCALLTVIVVSIGLEGFRLGRDGQTYGKRMAGIRVVRMPDGGPLGRGGAGTRRTLLFWLFAILPVVDIAALGGVLWGRPYRQGAHEKATSTVTIKA